MKCFDTIFIVCCFFNCWNNWSCPYEWRLARYKLFCKTRDEMKMKNKNIKMRQGKIVQDLPNISMKYDYLWIFIHIQQQPN